MPLIDTARLTEELLAAPPTTSATVTASASATRTTSTAVTAPATTSATALATAPGAVTTSATRAAAVTPTGTPSATRTASRSATATATATADDFRPGAAPPLPGDPVHALRRRTAQRHWAPEPLDGDVLVQALGYAFEQDERLWRPAFPTLPAPSATVLVQRLLGVPDGCHRYAPGARRLEPEPHVVLPPLADLVLQLEFGDAPALVVVHGDLATAAERHGAGGHRLLLARGAALAHATWLAALSLGAAGSVFAGVLGAAGRTHLGIDGSGRAQLIGLALGSPHRVRSAPAPADRTGER
ncbi:nitroreductase family protein [Streptomyces sp. PKU-MA01144]|uniref:nitroreductase family protein n=1 Tax=Streptomyces sp. PKU-MA01144 TaxID=2729138 RepID=UPI002810FC7C|nr:nitroreductase family protein [Streptomyces sp. PKU-MA01144]